MYPFQTGRSTSGADASKRNPRPLPGKNGKTSSFIIDIRIVFVEQKIDVLIYKHKVVLDLNICLIIRIYFTGFCVWWVDVMAHSVKWISFVLLRRVYMIAFNNYCNFFL